MDLPTTLPLDGSLDPDVGDVAKVFAAPDDPADRPRWRAALDRWRTEARERLGWTGAVYDREAGRWASTSYSVALVWLWDERLFDHAAQRFTVDRFLEATAPHGGYDAVVLWHAYPIIGLDDRNQFDFYRDVPRLPALVDDLHARGLKVFVDYNPWDTGTRRPAHPDAEELALLVAELGVDGVFLDTLKQADDALVSSLLDADRPQVLEGESRVPTERIADHQLSWAQWFADSAAPGVLRAHWFERRHMMHATRRWNRDHSDELQSAWMNGTGVLVWDAVFGVWVGWNARDASTLRRMLRVQRALSTVLIEGTWTPLVDATPAALAADVHASRFEHDGLTLWTLVNRSDADWSGVALRTPEELVLLDVTAGTAVTDGVVVVPARGVTGVVGLRGPVPAAVAALLDVALRDAPSSDAAFPARATERVVPEPSRGAAPDDAVAVAGGPRTLEVAYRRRETGLYGEAPYVEEWKPLPPRLHDDRRTTVEVDLRPVRVARHEVTNAEFGRFLDATGYRPTCGSRFLASWSGGRPSTGTEHAPVTEVSLDDARAYARWAGARLPSEHEWQVAATEPGFERATPLVWSWTESEHSDGVTRFVILKGGADHVSVGSDWYADGGPRPPQWSFKLLLAGLGVERSPSIGFRLAWDDEVAS